MTMTAVYTDATAKVTISCTSIPALADAVLIERSPDQITWTTVRGAQALTPSGSAVSIDDYEYTDGAVNYYRASYVDQAQVGFQGNANAVTQTGTTTPSITPASWPAGGTALGTSVFAFVASTNTAVTVACATAGWSKVASIGTNIAVFAARWTASLAFPTVTGSGGVTGDTMIVKLVGYWNAAVPPTTVATQANASAQNIAYPAVTSPGPAPTTSDGALFAFKASINTGCTPTPATNETATGYSMITFADLNSSLAAGSLTLTGGASAVSDAIVMYFLQAPYMSQDTASVTPAQTKSWLKNPVRPFLNVPVTIAKTDDVTRKQRTGVFDVIARTLPVAVTDLQGPRQTTLTVLTQTATDLALIEGFFAPGEPLLLQPYASYAGGLTPTMYCVVDQSNGALTRQRLARQSTVRLVLIPLIEVAQPSPLIAATLSTYQTVVNTYTTYAALAAAKATYTAVLQLVGSVNDVVTT